MGGYSLSVEEARPRGNDQFSSGGRGDRSGGRGRGRGRDGGRFSGGRDGGRFSGGRDGGRFSGGRGRGGGGRFGGGRGRGRGTPNRPNLAAAGTGTLYIHLLNWMSSFFFL